MPLHVITGTAAPATAPTDLGQHYIDETNRIGYLSVGTDAVSDWVPVTGATGFAIINGYLCLPNAATGAYHRLAITNDASGTPVLYCYATPET